MKPSVYKQKLIEEKKKKAVKLYKSGLSTREVGKLVGRSHEWVAMIIRKLSTHAPLTHVD